MKHYSRRAPQGLDRRDDWRDHAACSGLGDIFLPRDEHHVSPDEPKRICVSCPVKTECLDAAMAEEGTADQFRRAGVRGGLTPAERAARAGQAQEHAAEAENARQALATKAAMAEALILQGFNDTQIAQSVGLANTTVGRLRRALGLPVQPRASKTHQQIFDERTQDESNGHKRWTTPSRQANVMGHTYTAARLAFRVGHGREPEGQVTSVCGRPGCVAPTHLADARLRRQTRQAVNA